MRISLNDPHSHLEIGDLVEVLSREEIYCTLDEDGALDGLPFMPEMLEHCGHRYHLSQRARKSCVETEKGYIDMRGLRGQDVWILDQLRCSGALHDGCQRGCLIFWKTAWLRKVTDDAPPLQRVFVGEVPRRHLRSKVTSDRYFCQSTELVRATRSLLLVERLLLSLDCFRFRGICEFLKRVFLPIFWKAIHRFVIPRHVVGTLSRTPNIALGLKSGDRVEIRCAEDIAKTLNGQGCNRGLRYDRGLNRFCGTRFRVRDRLDKMIIESTGKMVHLEGTVTLENSCCLCHLSAVGGCPRQDLVYWREAWLKRVHGIPEHGITADSEARGSASFDR